MSTILTNQFSAAGSALGYLAQVEYALLIALRRMDGEDLRLSLETVDDITFESSGSALELWQTKHHVGQQGSLGDASPDLWKTLHNWIETSDDRSACFLFTTATASSDTAASLLGPEMSFRNVRAARDKLDTVAEAAGNKNSAKFYNAYLSLDGDARMELLNRVVVLDSAVTGENITDQLLSSVTKATIRPRRLHLVERLRGWWHGRAMTHLTKVSQGWPDWIEILEIEERLHSIAQSLRDENLPLDFHDEPEPTHADVREDDRIFVEQLKIIMLHHERIRQAIYDHNRAFLQRSRWQREDLLIVGELDAYDRRLKEEWGRIFYPLEEPDPNEAPSDEAKRTRAQTVFGALQERMLPEIRKDVRSGYIPLGSLHILADRLQIGWHPDWVELLKDRLAEADGAEGKLRSA